MSALLRKHLGVARKDITVLHHRRVTKANIMNKLKDMVGGGKAGNYSRLVFTLVNHGTQVPDLDGDERDRIDEAFCPHDLDEFGGQRDGNFIIVGDELRDLFIQLPTDLLLELFLDTCHNGTEFKPTDILLTRKPRYLPPLSLKAFIKVEGKRSRGLQRSMLEPGSVHHILWAGYRADQTSADARTGDSWRRAFMYYFCQETNASNNHLSRAAILAKVGAGLAAENYSQIPQLECEATKRKLMAG